MCEGGFSEVQGSAFVRRGHSAGSRVCGARETDRQAAISTANCFLPGAAVLLQAQASKIMGAADNRERPELRKEIDVPRAKAAALLVIAMALAASAAVEAATGQRWSGRHAPTRPLS